MPSISSYFNPCAREFQACNDFKTLSLGQRIGVSILTALAAICTLGLLATPIFRVLTGRFTYLNNQPLPQTANKTQQISQSVLSDTTQTTSVPVIPSLLPIPQTKPADATVATIPTSTPATSPTPVPPPTPPVTTAPIVSTSPTPTAVPHKAVPQKAVTSPTQPLPPTPLEVHTPPPKVPSPLPKATPPRPIPVTPAILFEKSLGYPPEAKPPMKKTTELKRDWIKYKLSEKGKKHGEAIDNGDCFFHAFAQALNAHRAKRGEALVTVVELRKQVAGYVKSSSWVEKLCREDSIICPEGYTRYVKEVANAHNTGEIPLWGHPKRDGKVLCFLYNVNLTTYLADIQEVTKTEAEKALNDATTRQALFSDTDRCIFGPDGNESITIPKAKATLEIVSYPKHYLPVFSD